MRVMISQVWFFQQQVLLLLMLLLLPLERELELRPALLSVCVVGFGEGEKVALGKCQSVKETQVKRGRRKQVLE